MTELGIPIMPVSNLLEFSMTASTKLCKKNRLQLSHAKRAILQEWREADKNAVRARGSSLDPIEEEVSRIGFAGIIAGTFDFLGLEGLIDSLVGKIGSHVMVNTGAITKALVMQMLQAPYQTLYGTSEFFARMPIGPLLNLEISAKDLNREVLGRYLDDIYDATPDSLFVKLAAKTCEKLGISIQEVHLDSTSFSYDGHVKEEDMCEMKIDFGYSRDHHEELPQVCLLGITDGKSRMPIFTKAVSGSKPDVKSFLDVVGGDWPLLQEQFNDLRYLVGDSALCTSDILKAAREKGILLVTRVPDKYKFVKDAYLASASEELTKIYEIGEDDQNYGKWCGSQEIGGIPLKLLLVKNLERRESKEATVRRRAEKELDKLQTALKKMRTQPAKCRADAEKNLNELKAKCRACTITDVEYTEVKKNKRRGRPKAGEEAETVTVAVQVTAKVAISEDYIKAKVEEEIMFVIGTTDTQRDWTMAELLSTYKRQSTIERMWKLSKDPKICLDALYLKTPHRIVALMWILSVALLVFAATEHLLKEAMNRENIRMPTPDHRTELAIPTLLRLKQYVDNSNINLLFIPKDNSFKIAGLTDVFVQILEAMGFEWLKYYQKRTYTLFLSELCAEGISD